MPKESVFDYSTTAGSNEDIDGVDLTGATGLVKNGDNYVRSLMAHLRKFANDLGAVNTVGGTGDAITVTLASGIAAYATGQIFRFTAGADNTGATTINVNAIGAKAIRKISGGADVALVAGDILDGKTYLATYNAAANSAAGAFIIDPGATTAFVTAAASRAGYIRGLTLSNGTDATNDIDIAAGSAADSTDADIITLGSALTKRLDAAWAVGTGNGGRDTGAIANTTYHVWLIKRSDTGVVDALFSTSATSPTMPANYDYKRRIGSIIRQSGAILAFTQFGNYFYLTSAVTDRDSTAAAADALLTLSVPSGITVMPFMDILHTAQTSSTNSVEVGHGTRSTAELLLIYYSGAPAFTFAAQIAGMVYTNTSSQIRICVTIGAGSVLNSIWKTHGWLDVNRGGV
jgi:hypothetical protein